MALPWLHSVVPVARNIPCDIDDLIPVLSADDGLYTPFENGPLGYGRFDVGQLRRGKSNLSLANTSDSVCSASRRSDDPGVVELSTISLPPNPQHEDASLDLAVSSIKPYHGLTALPVPIKPYHGLTALPVPDLQLVEGNNPGEVSLQCFENAFQRKTRRVRQSRRYARKQYVSVKINSSSSRATIFSNDEKEHARLLEATLPLEVQNGRFLSASKAQGIAEKLGSYNWRHGLGPNNHSGKNSNRVSVGRTRLMWTEKSPSEQPQRVYFTSVLSGEKLESGTQKRPREIKVGIRLNGKLWPGEKKDCPSHASDILVNQSRIGSLLGHREGESHPGTNPLLQCSLDSSMLVQSLLENSEDSRTEKITDGKRGDTPSSSKVFLKHPQIDCIPDTDGLIRTICTSPGSISTSSIHEILNNAAQRKRLCTVCWSAKNDESFDADKCSECGVLAHRKCCLNPGLGGRSWANPNPNPWKCASCYKMQGKSESESLGSTSSSGKGSKPKRRSRPPPWLQDSQIASLGSKRPDAANGSTLHERKCDLCPYSGGAMSPIRKKGQVVWVHEVCRIWACRNGGGHLLDTDRFGCQDSQICALCGLEDDGARSLFRTGASCLIKCASARCQVYFHPMCALLSSKLSKGRSKEKISSQEDAPLQAAKSGDLELCSQYSLTFLRCKGEEGARGEDPGETYSQTIPVGLCGIHNPRREPTFYGLYPGGKFLDPKLLRIPAVKK